MEKLPFKGNKLILIAFLAGITIFSVYKYTMAIKEKNALLAQLNQANQQVTILQKQKQNLVQTLEKEKEVSLQLKQNLRAGVRKINKANMALSEIKSELQQVNSEIVALKAQNKALEDAKENIEKEKDALQARLSSAIELKKAINELKKQAYKVGVQVIEKTQERKNVEGMGNQGFVIKDGKPTYPSEVKIEVSPAPKEK